MKPSFSFLPFLILSAAGSTVPSDARQPAGAANAACELVTRALRSVEARGLLSSGGVSGVLDAVVAEVRKKTTRRDPAGAGVVEPEPLNVAQLVSDCPGVARALRATVGRLGRRSPAPQEVGTTVLGFADSPLYQEWTCQLRGLTIQGMPVGSCMDFLPDIFFSCTEQGGAEGCLDAILDGLKQFDSVGCEDVANALVKCLENPTECTV